MFLDLGIFLASKECSLSTSPTLIFHKILSTYNLTKSYAACGKFIVVFTNTTTSCAFCKMVPLLLGCSFRMACLRQVPTRSWGSFPWPIMSFHSTSDWQLWAHYQAWIPSHMKPTSSSLELTCTTIAPNYVFFWKKHLILSSIPNVN